MNPHETAKDAIEMAGYDYTVVKKPLELKTEVMQGAYESIPFSLANYAGVNLEFNHNI